MSLPPLSDDECLFLSNDGFKRLAQCWDPKIPLKNYEWTTDYTLELPIKLKKSGPGSETPITLIEVFQNVVKKIPKFPAMRVKRNKKWLYWTYSEYLRDVGNFAKGLISLGLTPYSSVNILGFNSPEWLITFYGSIFGNYLPVGIYTTNNAEACKYVSMHSDAELVVVEDKIQLNKYLQVWADLPKLKYVIIYSEPVPENLPFERKGQVLSFKQLLENGAKFTPQKPEDALEHRMSQQKPGNCCTLVYTSGTTGNPKGVMLSHDNYTWLGKIWADAFKLQFGSERIVSYLPLSHVAGQIIDLISTLIFGGELVFAEPTALQGTLGITLREVRPTFFFGVPRVWEKIEENIKVLLGQRNAFQRSLERWARSHGVEGTLAQIQGKPTSASFNLADRLFYSKLKYLLGFDQTRSFSFGAAPMAAQTREYFLSLNLFLRNVYGMSESSGPDTLTDPKLIRKFDQNTLNSCGAKLPGTDLILHAVDRDGNGELCYKGRNRFMGYYKNEEETRNTIDERGFLHSGDVGQLDELGNVRITGRIKELIITAGGENVAPVLIENQVKKELPFISNAMVIGDKRKYLVIVLTLKLAMNANGTVSESLNEDGLKVIQGLGSTAKTYGEVLKDEKILKEIDEGIKRANENSISRAHYIRKWTLIPGDFTVGGGELTPTLKLKRKTTASKYADAILKLYQDPKL